MHRRSETDFDRRKLYLPMIMILVLGWSTSVTRHALAGAIAPLENPEDVSWSHAPFEVGACSICHEADDPSAPGKVVQPVNELCEGCHEQFAVEVAGRNLLHPPVEDSCTNCHNPHNAAQRKLLVSPIVELCTGCHDDVGEAATSSSVSHGAVTQGRACVSCHNPHASDVENLLISLPYDLCLNCHGRDGLRDDGGRPLANILNLIESKPVKHGPVDAKDCSSCHRVHGADHFRLLIEEYPAKFYSPYDPANYALCFECHNDQILAYPRTEKLTRFRDGERNLHYLHVNKEDRGRTCRACHEVHAAEHAHLIREGVPYGKSGWVLPINYRQTQDGGTCERTCHSLKKYDRSIRILPDETK